MTSIATRRQTLALLSGTAGLALIEAPAFAQTAPGGIYKGPGVAMHGPPKYKGGFAHFDYVNPAAPKGGNFYQAGAGTFDNLNPFIIRGTPAAGVSNLTFDRLMKRSEDEPFSEYPLIAKTIEMPADRGWVAFELDERARFHDGAPVTAEDVLFSLDILRKSGRPNYRLYFKDVTKAEATGRLGVRFTFKNNENRELPLILAGDLPILPKHYWQARAFDRSTLDPPLGGGPYKIGKVTPGRSIEFERVADYWAADLPVNRGHNNFDLYRIDYFRDATIVREALKAGEYDYRAENSALAWATAYNTDTVKSGQLVRREIRHARPTGMQAFVFNTRRWMFKDWRVRRALAFAFDFEWTNKNIFYDQYVRTRSYFANSEMAATGLPEGDELKVLEPFRGRVPDRVFSEPYTLPVYKGDGDIRDGLREAFRLFAEAGWEVRDFRLVEKASGRPMRFETITASPEFTRIYLPMVQNLKRMGVDLRVRVVDPSQYIKRVQKFDFDVVTQVWGQSESPGNEQRDNWTTEAADAEDSDNLAAIKDKAVDELVELVIAAPDREALVARCKALDRVLLAGHYVIPQYHVNSDRLVYWDKFGVPAPTRRGAASTLTWWVDPAKAERLRGRIRSLRAAG